MSPRSPLLPFLAAALGIAVYSGMDTLMKRLTIESGALAAVLWRSALAVVLMGVPFAAQWRAGRRRWPAGPALRLHALRGLASGASVLLFFWGLARVPMAKGVAVTFLAPLLASLLAAAFLGERVRRGALGGSVVAGLGVLAIAAGELRGGGGGAGGGAGDGRAVAGLAACVAASVIYAGSLVLLRRQAQRADPLEVAFFTSLVLTAATLPAAPWLAGWPARAQALPVAGAALLGTGSALLIAWAYARAEAQVIATTEYTAFVWSALFGWLAFGERLAGPTVLGAALIVGGCVAAVRGRPATEAGPLELGA